MRSSFRFLLVVVIATFSLSSFGCGESASDHGDAEPRSGDSTETQSQAVDSDALGSEADSSLAIFEKRILPIFQSKKPSSCTECHLSGVELASYIRPSQAETFSSLVAAKLIDRQRPDESKILKFIARRPQKPNLITEKVRKQEYEAFQSWIRAAVKSPQMLTNIEAKASGPEWSPEMIRHARQDRIMASFVDNIWTEVGRCAACHSPDRNQKQVEEHGEQVSWIKLNDPQATLDHMLDGGLINTETPLESMLLTKPTMQVEHGGGKKMVVGDRTYKQFRRFIDDYSAIVNERYAKVEDLPKPSEEVSLVTDIWLKIEDVPSHFDQKLLQVDLYEWQNDAWSQSRVATSDRLVFGGGNLWQHSLSLTAPRGSQLEKQMNSKRLPQGRYLVKIFIDTTGKLKSSPQTNLSQADLVGQVEVESSWPAGYGRMTVIKFPQ